MSEALITTMQYTFFFLTVKLSPTSISIIKNLFKLYLFCMFSYFPHKPTTGFHHHKIQSNHQLEPGRTAFSSSFSLAFSYFLFWHHHLKLSALRDNLNQNGTLLLKYCFGLNTLLDGTFFQTLIKVLKGPISSFILCSFAL